MHTMEEKVTASHKIVSLLLQLKYNTPRMFFDNILKKFFNKFYNYS